MAHDLPSYIRSFDSNVMRAIDKAAQRWELPAGTVKAWLYGERTPRPETARQIIAKEKGRLTMEAIYRGPQ